MAEVRAANPADAAQIQSVVQGAFKLQGETGEAALVTALSADEDPRLINLVAVLGELIVGHVMASATSLDPEASPSLSVLGVAPVSVALEYQGQGIGSALMRALILRAREAGADSMVVLGSPEYYGRFGFVASHLGNEYGAGPAFQHIELMEGCLAGVVGTCKYHEAFRALG
eukprot:TRINITY_DN858_c0_g1_i1.p1 TRINITY_DN858_c0_g1~~TRINITY_DN858_c0_g1_i1.p1  ORF type:complete len:172 (+),score=29.06 TRINITY_DN858_c0_g1_i1:42-557(+)